jgi:hypothetical protein
LAKAEAEGRPSYRSEELDKTQPQPCSEPNCKNIAVLLIAPRGVDPQPLCKGHALIRFVQWTEASSLSLA